MIEFTCSGCSRTFTVPDSFAGRRAKCKSCGAPIEVPNPAAVPAGASETHPHPAPAETPAAAAAPTPALDAPPPPVRRIPMRVRRLMADAEQMSTAFQGFPLIRVLSAIGEPPETYTVEYQVKSLDRTPRKKDPIPRETHRVEIQLTSDYPRVSPKCKMLTPIFHPNIDPTTICVGDHWAAGERLVDLVIRIGEMLAFQAYNIKSPLDAEAAMWADLHQADLPTDSRSMRPPNLE